MTTSKADILREYGPFPGVDQVHGVTFDGKAVWFASGDKVNALDPDDGRLLRTIDLSAHAGTAYDGRHLFQIAEDRIHKIDPETGTVRRTIESNRMVTGVTWVDGELWHGTWEGEESDLRRLDPKTGAVLDTITMPAGIGVSGLESDGADRFFCGGGNSGKIRAIRRPR